MKPNPLVFIGLLAAWVLMLTLLICLHWRPAKVMLPVISIILLLYVGMCTVSALLHWLRGAPKAETAEKEEEVQ